MAFCETSNSTLDGPGSGRPTVLVVDDEPLVRMSAVDVLSDAGFLVREASSAADALEELKRHPKVSVLFSDINMPGAFDGLELARQVHLLRPDVQLILTSGRIRPTRAEMPDGSFLAKPYDGQAVSNLIHAARAAARGDAS